MLVKMIVKNSSGEIVETEQDVVQMIRMLQKMIDGSSSVENGMIPTFISEIEPDAGGKEHLWLKVNRDENN